jgi:hypothetical protein
MFLHDQIRNKVKNIYSNKSFEFVSKKGLRFVGHRCDCDVTAHVKLRNFDGFFVFECGGWFLVDFADYINDFA